MKELLICIIYLIGLKSWCQPEWIQSKSRELVYPDSEFIKGFAVTPFENISDTLELLNRVEGYARHGLYENFQKLLNEHWHLSQSQSLVGNLISSTILKESGMNTYVYVDTNSSSIYSLAVLAKKNLIRTYFVMLSNSLKVVETKLDQTKVLDGIKEIQYAKGIQAMLELMGVSNPIVLSKERLSILEHKWNLKIQNQKQDGNDSLDEVVDLMVSELMFDANVQQRPIVIGSILGDQNSLNPHLSLRLQSELVEVFKQFNRSAILSVLHNQPYYLLSGGFISKDSNVKINLTLEEYHDSERIKYISGSSGYLISNHELLGVNLSNDNYIDSIDFYIANTISKELYLEFRTNKPGDHVLYQVDEQVKLSVHVNRPAYIRLINIWSDSRMSVLLDNYYLALEHIGTNYELPFEWKVSCPCGSEHLLLIASQFPLKSIETYDENGNDFIMGSWRRFFSEIRNAKGNQYMAEGLLTITTVNVANE